MTPQDTPDDFIDEWEYQGYMCRLTKGPFGGYSGWVRADLEKSCSYDDLKAVIGPALPYFVDGNWIGFALLPSWDLCVDSQGNELEFPDGVEWGRSNEEHVSTWAPRDVRSKTENLADELSNIQVPPLDHQG